MTDDQIEAWAERIAHEANRSNDSDGFAEAEQVALDAARTALFEMKDHMTMRAQADAQPLYTHPAPEAAKTWSEHDIGTIAATFRDDPIGLVRAVLRQVTANQAAQALSDEEIQALWNEAYRDTPQKPGWCRHIRFARSIESTILTRASAATVAEPSAGISNLIVSVIVRKARQGRFEQGYGAVRTFLADAGLLKEPAQQQDEPNETDRAVRCLSREPSEKVKAIYSAWAHENGRRAKVLADRIIDDYLLHYDFPTQGQSHMQDCIVSVLSTALTEAPVAAPTQGDAQ